MTTDELLDELLTVCDGVNEIPPGDGESWMPCSLVWFANPDDRHEATRRAQRYIKENGWSVWSTEVSGNRGVIFAPGVLVAKWKNLTLHERAECDALLVGRAGGTITFLPRDISKWLTAATS